jgi:serine/threonine-protein kinase
MTSGSSESIAAPAGMPPPDVPGYRLLRPVGAGGMGSVYAAEQLSTHQILALKLIQGRHAVHSSFVQRFEREIGALREIRHPNVVQVFDWHLPTSEGDPVPPYLVMELLRGEGLDQLFKRESRLGPGRAVAIMLQVLDALAAAHRIGVLHRDIGPGNVFLVQQPEGGVTAKVLDFGLARLGGSGSESDLTQPGTVIGKPGYVAPELLLDRPVDERADVFACGMLLYRMTVGRLPFSQKKAELLWAERFAERATTDEYAPPSAHAPDLEPALDAVIVKAIRRRPEERFQSAREMQNQLLTAEAVLPDRLAAPAAQPAFGGSDVKSSPAVAGGTTELHMDDARRSRRGPWIAALVVATLAIIGALLWVFVFAGRGSSSADVPAVQPVAVAPPVGTAPVPVAPPLASEALPSADAADTSAPAGDALPLPPPADAAATTAEAEAGAGAKTVRVSFEGLPRGASLRVDGQDVVGSAVYLPASEALLAFEVRAAGFEPYQGSFQPSADRLIRVQLVRARGAGTGRRPPADAGTAGARQDGGTMHGRTGTTFVTEYGEE